MAKDKKKKCDAPISPDRPGMLILAEELLPMAGGRRRRSVSLALLQQFFLPRLTLLICSPCGRASCHHPN